ncbi:MAG: TfoX/Sxy family protein [Acholeplasmatales bacterium]|nr:TfoX/Sxy family protein [Acholeplasmatales bacterium]
MSSSIDYLEYVLDLLSDIENITYKKMMGEYILYCDGIIFGGIYDNRFLIKKTKSLENMGFKEEIPYPSAKPMYLVDIENREEINELIYNLINDLK